MKTIMKPEDLTTIDQLEDFLSGTQAIALRPATASLRKDSAQIFKDR